MENEIEYMKHYNDECTRNPAEYVQYGCGMSAPKGWKNYDASPTLRFERIPVIGRLYTKNKLRFPSNVVYGDIVKGLPIADQSCAGVYSSHVLEHLALDDFRVALKNTHRILRQGGIFRLVVPDLAIFAQRYVNSDSSGAAEEFLRTTALGVVRRKRGLTAVIRGMLANSEHLWMWDYSSLKRELLNAGFVDIRRCFAGDCSDKHFLHVENPERFVDAVAIECIRPRI